MNGPLKEILKHNPKEVVSIDLDPELDGLVAPYLPEDLRQTLKDPRIKFWYGDSRAFFRKSREPFDVIIANLPDPMSILIDRNYTEEFFWDGRQRLKEGGVFLTHLGFAANYVTPELERLGGSIYGTLQDTFRDVKVLPEDTLYFLASNGPINLSDVEAMEKRMIERGISADYVTPDYLRYRFTNDRVKQVKTLFANSVWQDKNYDLRPRTYYFAFTRWLSLFHSKVSRFLLAVTEIPFAFIFIGFMLLFAAPLFIPGSPAGNTQRLSLAAMRVGGFTVMTFEVVLIYLFQVFLGDLYFRIAILITAFMAGIGIGAWAGVAWKPHSSKRVLAGAFLVSAVTYLGLVLLIHEFRHTLIFRNGWEWLFYAAAVASGILAGFEFPLANDLYLKKAHGTRAGAVYAADLFGASLGALVTAGFLIPVWGIRRTLILLIGLNAMIALFLIFRKDAPGSGSFFKEKGV